MRNRKKALSLPVQVIVGVIVAIVFFSIVLGLYIRFQPKDIINKQVCHQSALLRHAANTDFTETVKATIPLQCQTEKLCINAGNSLTRAFSGNPLKLKETWERAQGECRQFSESKSGVKTISITGDERKAKEQIIKSIADGMVDCWKTVGEGYLDYSPRGKEKASFCSICARIAFDESVKDSGINKITYQELFKYMETTQLPSETYTKKISYLKYLYNKESLDSLNEQIKKAIDQGQADEKRGVDYLLNPQFFQKNGKTASIYDLDIDTSENSEYAIITKFTKEKGWNDLLFGGAGGAALFSAAGIAGLLVVSAATGGLVTVGLGTIALIAAAGGTVGAGTVFFSEDFNGVHTSRVTLIQYPHDLDQYQCTSFEWIQ